MFFENANHIDLEKKENYVLYNPTKGVAFTQKIIEYCENHHLNAEFIPLKNMSASEVSDWMRKAKVYMDFGEFPGPERIPREAVIMGCNIITSKNGAAGNDIDVPIPEFLKYEDEESNLEAIFKTMAEIIGSYDKYYHCYDKYRDKVRNQKAELNKNIIQLEMMFQKQ